MRPLLAFHRLAEEELGDEADYYFNIDPTLEIKFLESVERALGEILENPKTSLMIIGGVRRKLISRFPFSIYYLPRSETIRILAIAHNKRRPYYWLDRK